MIKLIVTVCALYGAQECTTQETEVASLQLCRVAVGIAQANIDKRREDGTLDATYEFSCVDAS